MLILSFYYLKTNRGFHAGVKLLIKYNFKFVKNGSVEILYKGYK